METIVNPEAYRPPDHFRYASHVSKKLGFQCEILGETGGYLYRVSDGERELLLGAGRVSAYPINSVVAVSVAKDKIFTNVLLDREGIPNLGGRPYFLNQDDRRLRDEGFDLKDARDFLRLLGFPCFVKPLSGSRGDFAQVLWSVEQFEKYVESLRRKHDSLILQKVFYGPEYRVLVLDDEAVFCIQKSDFVICGDGRSSIAEILRRLNQTVAGKGLSGIPEDEPLLNFEGAQVETSKILPAGMEIKVVGRRNLSAGRDSGLLIEDIPEDLKRLAIRASQAIGLRVSGVDLMQVSGESSARVIEVNASPGIHSLEHLGRWDLIEKIWSKVLYAGFSSPNARSIPSRNF